MTDPRTSSPHLGPDVRLPGELAREEMYVVRDVIGERELGRAVRQPAFDG